MFTHDLTRLQLHDLAGAFPQVTLDKLIVVDFSQETDALTIFPLGTGQFLRLCDRTHLALHQMANREHQLLNL